MLAAQAALSVDAPSPPSAASREAAKHAGMFGACVLKDQDFHASSDVALIAILRRRPEKFHTQSVA